jgi:hypothetical protein
MSSVFSNLLEKTYSNVSIEGTAKEKHLLRHDSHWKGFTAAHLGRQHKHHSSGNGVPTFTWRTISMAAMVSMGGMIFGYDTGKSNLIVDSVWI